MLSSVPVELEFSLLADLQEDDEGLRCSVSKRSRGMSNSAAFMRRWNSACRRVSGSACCVWGGVDEPSSPLSPILRRWRAAALPMDSNRRFSAVRTLARHRSIFMLARLGTKRSPYAGDFCEWRALPRDRSRLSIGDSDVKRGIVFAPSCPL